jgi:flagellar hook assembly protein FlgD
VYCQWQDWRGNWSSPTTAHVTVTRPLFIISASVKPTSFGRGGHTTFTYQTNKSAYGKVQLKNAHGTIIRTWTLKTFTSAVHSMIWAGKLANGVWVPNGTYALRLVATNHTTATGNWHTVKVV